MFGSVRPFVQVILAFCEERRIHIAMWTLFDSTILLHGDIISVFFSNASSVGPFDRVGWFVLVISIHGNLHFRLAIPYAHRACRIVRNALRTQAWKQRVLAKPRRCGVPDLLWPLQPFGDIVRTSFSFDVSSKEVTAYDTENGEGSYGGAEP